MLLALASMPGSCLGGSGLSEGEKDNGQLGATNPTYHPPNTLHCTMLHTAHILIFETICCMLLSLLCNINSSVFFTENCKRHTIYHIPPVYTLEYPRSDIRSRAETIHCKLMLHSHHHIAPLLCSMRNAQHLLNTTYIL